MERKKLLFVFNPYSGKGQIKNKLLGIVDQFVKSGYEVTIYPTQKPQDAMELVKRGDKAQRQVFLYNKVYFTDEPGTGEEEFLSDFFKWKTKLYVAAGIYTILGAICVLVGNRITLYHDNDGISNATVIK